MEKGKVERKNNKHHQLKVLEKQANGLMTLQERVSDFFEYFRLRAQLEHRVLIISK